MSTFTQRARGTCLHNTHEQVDLTSKQSYWKALKPPAKDKCGELLSSLCYHPSNSILTLTLIKARNLKAKDINGKSGKDQSRFEIGPRRAIPYQSAIAEF